MGVGRKRGRWYMEGFLYTTHLQLEIKWSRTTHYMNSFIPSMARLWNSPPNSCIYSDHGDLMCLQIFQEECKHVASNICVELAFLVFSILFSSFPPSTLIELVLWCGSHTCCSSVLGNSP